MDEVRMRGARELLDQDELNHEEQHMLLMRLARYLVGKESKKTLRRQVYDYSRTAVYSQGALGVPPAEEVEDVDFGTGDPGDHSSGGDSDAGHSVDDHR